MGSISTERSEPSEEAMPETEDATCRFASGSVRDYYWKDYITEENF